MIYPHSNLLGILPLFSWTRGHSASSLSRGGLVLLSSTYLAFGCEEMYWMASVQVKILSASLSGISSPNSSSNAITTSTVSKLSRPKSLTKCEDSFT